MTTCVPHARRFSPSLRPSQFSCGHETRSDCRIQAGPAFRPRSRRRAGNTHLISLAISSSVSRLLLSMKISSSTMATRPTMEPSVAAAITPALEAAVGADRTDQFLVPDKGRVTPPTVSPTAPAIHRSVTNLGYDGGGVTAFHGRL